LVIVVNSVLLGLHDYSTRLYLDNYETTIGDAYSFNEKLELYESIFSIIFIVECLTKIVAMGFILYKNAYLRTAWNVLDFFVVIILVLEMLPGGHMKNYSSIKVFRTLRLLRPLRSIQKVPRLRILVTTLLRSIMGLLNVTLFLIFIASVFSILGVH
jgi:hypothetical protein